MQYWLVKSEPETYSISDLKREGVGRWDGIRNYQARNFLRQMKIGDAALFYHSSAGQGIGVAGLMTVASMTYPDPLQFNTKSPYYDPRATSAKPLWDAIDMQFVEAFPRVVTLPTLKADAALAGMRLLMPGNRLSVVPLTKRQFEHIVRLAQSVRKGKANG